MLSARTWKLDRYAKQVKHGANNKTTWDIAYPSSNDSGLTLSILNDHKLIIADGTTKIYESLMLWESETWIKGVQQGCAILLMIRNPINNSVRKIRFKFIPDGDLTGEEQCAEAHMCMSAYFKFEKEYTKETFSQFEREPKPSNSSGNKLLLSDMGKLMLSGDVAQVLGAAYAKTTYPKEQLRHMLSLCLADPNFPGFVAEVEEQLKNITHNTVPHSGS